jgi:hypothetical protein
MIGTLSEGLLNSEYSLTEARVRPRQAKRCGAYIPKYDCARVGFTLTFYHGDSRKDQSGCDCR